MSAASRRELKRSDLLVVGYEGTLSPRDESSKPGHTWAGSRLLTLWAEDAMSDLVHRTRRELLSFCGELVPLSGLRCILEQRLLGLATPAFFAALAADANAHGNSLQPDPEALCQPVLQHLLRSTIADWVSATIVFLERFDRDHKSLASALGFGRLPPVQSLTGCASDVHAGGHSVLRIEFRGGPTVFYKPRPVAGEWLWRGLLDAVAEQDAELHLPAMRVLSAPERRHYGWVDSLGSGNVATVGAPSARYWHRAGAVLCLAQHVRLTDLHMANVLATDDGPAVLDAECLATPQLAPKGGRESAAEPRGFAAALESLAATRLLPGEAVPGRPDVSGLFGWPGPVGGLTLPCWRVAEGGRVRLEKCAAELINQQNAPEQTTPAAVLPALIDGYRHAAEVLLHARKRLLASRWRWVLERQHAPRVVLRETLTYALWISRSVAPEYLVSAPCRRAALRATMVAESAGVAATQALLRAESAALLRGQIPRFLLEPRRRALASTAGRVILPGFSAEPPAHAVMRELDGLSRERLNEVLVPALLGACLRI